MTTTSGSDIAVLSPDGRHVGMTGAQRKALWMADAVAQWQGLARPFKPLSREFFSQTFCSFPLGLA